MYIYENKTDKFIIEFLHSTIKSRKNSEYYRVYSTTWIFSHSIIELSIKAPINQMPPTCFRNLRELYVIFFCFCALAISRTGQSRHQHRNLPVSPSVSLFCHLQSRLTQHFNFLHCRSAWAVETLWNCSWANGKSCSALREWRNKSKEIVYRLFYLFPF